MRQSIPACRLASRQLAQFADKPLQFELVLTVGRVLGMVHLLFSTGSLSLYCFYREFFEMDIWVEERP
jgi:hypothetical protein